VNGGERVPFQAIPRELVFYDLFERAAANVSEGARELAALVDDLAEGEARSARIRDLEHEGDRLTREVMKRLDITFVTPFDRDDIHALASGLDDILDAVWAAADLLVLHHVEEPLPELGQLVRVLIRAAEAMVEAVARLRTLEGLNGYLVEINRLENEGDRVYRKAVARLYSGEFRAMDVLKWKDVMDQVEAAIDGCEDIANVIESIGLKHD
jgi:uncharacterized protein